MDHEEFFFFFLQCGSDPNNAANLVSIPQHFDTEIYAEHRLQKVKKHLFKCYFFFHVCPYMSIAS